VGFAREWMLSRVKAYFKYASTGRLFV
jgi:hypothetical protein